MDPSVLLQASSVNKTLTTLRTWMRLDAEVRLQVPEPKTLFQSQSSGFRELPCKVILFLESLITVDTGEGTMKGAGFMSSHMGPILACHLKETDEHKGNSCLQMKSAICEQVTITRDSCNWIIYFGLAMTSKVGGWNRKKTRKIQEDGNANKNYHLECSVPPTWNVLSQWGQAMLPSCFALCVLLCCCNWYWDVQILPHLSQI